MTHPTTAQAPTVSQHFDNSPASLLFGTAFAAGSTALVAGAFTAISPLGGAIFGASSFLAGRLINFICDKVECCPDSMVAKCSKVALSFLGGIGAAILITTFVGFPMTFTAGLVLTVGTMAATIGAGIAFAGCICSSALATGIALGAGGTNTPNTHV